MIATALTVSFFAILVLLYQSQVNTQELFTAVSHGKSITKTEATIADLLHKYVVAETDRYEKLKLFRHEKLKLFRYDFMEVNSVTMDDPESYLAHPVNAYLLTKRLTTDLKQVESLILPGPSA